MRKIAIGIVLLIASSAVAQATFNAEIEPIPTLTAGCNEPIQMNFTSDVETQVWLEYTISPSEEGFLITFSEDTFTFTGEKTIVATITTSPALIPDEYTIQIDYKYIIKEENNPTEENNDQKGGGPVYASGTRAPEEPEEEPTEEPNEDPPPVANIQEGSFTFNTRGPNEERDITKYLEWGAISVLAGIIIILLIIIKKKQEKNQ